MHWYTIFIPLFDILSICQSSLAEATVDLFLEYLIIQSEHKTFWSSLSIDIGHSNSLFWKNAQKAPTSYLVVLFCFSDVVYVS